MEKYALAKANIFRNQKIHNSLILNNENDWTDFFIKQKPKSDIWFFSSKKISGNKKGIYYKDGFVYFKNKKTERVLNIKKFVDIWGKHNLENLLSSILAAYLAGEKWSDIQKRIKDIPQIKYRQELVKKYKKTIIINDTSATSPEGGMAAIERFGSPTCILITGGTDADLQYKDWAKTAIKYIPLKNIVFLEGTATKKMLQEISGYIDISKVSIKNNLEDCIDLSIEKIKEFKTKSTILFSPASKSFGKFKNEFDRGEKFNKLIKSKTA
jgi:UDP-N-acetylmuramoylalanine--D-glutamate ligase